MPQGAYIETPQTTLEQTDLNDGIDVLDRMSPEKSFVSPSKGRDLLSKARRGISLTTPHGGRNPLRLLPNGSVNKREFSPMMGSAGKKNRVPRSSTKRGVATPSFLRNSMSHGNSPALPPLGEQSQIYDDGTTNSAPEVVNVSQMPQMVSSSVASTPLAALPYRDGRDGVVGDGNIMSLRDQEKVSYMD